MQLDLIQFSELCRKASANSNSGSFIINFIQKIDKYQWEAGTRNILNGESDYFYCSRPSKEFSFTAAGPLISITGGITADYSEASALLERLKKRIISNSGLFKNLTYPFFIGTVKFPSSKRESLWEEFPYSDWFVPEIALFNKNSEYFLIVNALYYRGIERALELRLHDLSAPNETSTTPLPVKANKFHSGPALNDWTNRLKTAFENIAEKRISKIVLARYADLTLEKEAPVPSLLASLEDSYKECYSFCRHRGNSFFFGASPEKLFSVDNNLLETDALAGSFPRGVDHASDLALENELRSDPKNLREHHNVIEFLIERLSGISSGIDFNKFPEIKKLSNIQHLYTPIKAIIKEGISPFTIIGELFPTPAVCGTPRTASERLIEEIEDFERGLYAGTLGWIGLNNSAEFFVGLRSAILKENNLRAFAGCGIVDGSDAETEYSETFLKLKPILSLFNYETVN